MKLSNQAPAVSKMFQTPCRRLIAASLVGVALGTAGCSSLRMPESKPKAEVGSMQFGSRGTQDSVTPMQLHSEVGRFADDYVATVAQAADDFGAKIGTAEARQATLKWKLSQATAAIINACGDNPVTEALDMVVLASVSRMVAEDFLSRPDYREAGAPYLDAHRKLETNAWEIVNGFLTPDQIQELKELIRQWRQQNPNQRYVGTVRFREFAAASGPVPKQSMLKTGSIFSLLYIDPMAGLDPAARAIEETRQVVERMMFYGQRLAPLITWQTELLTLQLADQPASKQLLADTERFSRAAEAVTKTVDQLPKLVDEQRQAAIAQLLAGVASERSNILSGMAAEEVKFHQLLTDTRQALDAGGQMATSLNAAIKSLDAFVRYVSPPDTNTVSQPPDTNSPPFNILDYGTAADHIAAMSKDINALLTSVNQTMPELAKLSQQVEANASRAVDRAFWRGVVLIVILLAGSVLAGLAYRFLADKLVRRQGASPSTSQRE